MTEDMNMGRPRTQNPICTVKDCGGKTIARGLCMAHYRRARRTELGDTVNVALDAPRTEQRGLIALPPARLTPAMHAAYESLAKSQGISTYELTRRLIEKYVVDTMTQGMTHRS